MVDLFQMPVAQLTASFSAYIGRVLFIYYFIQLSYTPLLLALSFSVVDLLTSGYRLWKNFEGNSKAPIDLILSQAIDIIGFYVAISQVTPSTYAVVTLLVFCIRNVVSSRSRSRLGGLFFAMVATIIFSIGSKISLQALFITASSNLISIHARNLSARSNLRSSKSNSDLNDFTSAVLVACITLLTSADERILFWLRLSVTSDTYLLALLALWILATTAQWIWKKKEWQNTTQFSEMLLYTSSAIVTALVTLDGTDLLLTLVTTMVLLIAAYCSINTTTLDDRLTARARDDHRQTHGTKSWTLTLIVIAFTLIVSVHVNQFNTRDLRPTTSFNATAVYNNRTMPAAQRNMYRLQCLHKTRAAYIELLRPYFNRGRNYTIMDYPNHWNLGDAFIYVGQNIMFSIYGQPPVRPPFPHSSMSANVKNVSVVFLHGGGNFGDLYPGADNLRVRIKNFFLNASVVLMPQSVHYKDPKRLATMVKLYKHHSITMMVRDTESQNFVLGNFTYANVPYVPDSAFMIGAQLPNSDPIVDIMFLLRKDVETVVNYTLNNPKMMAQQYGLTSEVWDFPLQDFPRYMTKNKTLIYDMADIYPGRYQKYGIRPSTEAIAWYRTQMGNTMLSRGRVVVADRLHASIMATLIGRPVVYVDNNYRKTSRVRSSLTEFIPECTDAMLDAHYAPNISVAVKIAADLIKQMNDPPI